MHWKKSLAVTILSLGLSTMMMAQKAPVNPEASPEARALLKYFYKISGVYTLSGQHNYPLTIARWSDRALELTGKRPVIFGQDFGFTSGEDKDSILARPAMIEEVIRQYREHGAIPTLTWHCNSPFDEEPTVWKGGVQRKLSDAQWRELMTDGSPARLRWERQVDVIAGFLKQLEAAHVPVLMRPYHEMNGDWFWWGFRKGPEGSSKLFRLFEDRMVKVHHLNNLLWVWNVNAPDRGGMEIEDYYPGAGYVDILSLDVYSSFKQKFYEGMVKLASGKPVALGEVGYLPKASTLKKQPLWTYFMTWSEWVEEKNKLKNVRALFHSPEVANLEDARVQRAMAQVRRAGDAHPRAAAPATEGSSAAARALLAKISMGDKLLSGRAVGLSGANKPSIVAAELTKVDDLAKLAKSGAILKLSWRPESPARGPLGAAEWSSLLTPGSELNQRWAAEVDALAAQLESLQRAGVAVMFAPLPGMDGKAEWWANHPGPMGAQALWRQLFVELTQKRGLKNLLWLYESEAAPEWSFEYGGAFHDNFPGLLYVDALQLDAPTGNWSFDLERAFHVAAVGKPVGLGVVDKFGEASSLFGSDYWRWFVVERSSQADDALYASPRVERR